MNSIDAVMYAIWMNVVRIKTVGEQGTGNGEQTSFRVRRASGFSISPIGWTGSPR
jgi:hypothetical protein